MSKKNTAALQGRREFLAGAGALAGLTVLSSLPGISFAENLGVNQATLTVKQVINIVLSGVSPNPRTVDLLKFGNPDQVVSGIVTTTFPTIDVIKKAIKAGANMIVSHEALFYGLDDTPARLESSAAAKYKTDLLTKNKIAVFRFHDAWHAQKIDGITWGNLVKLGWDKYYDPANPKIITLPKAITLRDAVTLSKKALNAPQVRVIGDLNKPVKTVYLAFGSIPAAQLIPEIQKHKPDLVLAGETREWETCQRVRDGISMGLNTKLIVLGHAISEEAGMDYAANWLKPKVSGTKVTYIASGTPFQYV